MAKAPRQPTVVERVRSSTKIGPHTPVRPQPTGRISGSISEVRRVPRIVEILRELGEELEYLRSDSLPPPPCEGLLWFEKDDTTIYLEVSLPDPVAAADLTFHDGRVLLRLPRE